jgi:2-polyprenyl-3-methyl-5-hydroxy-6-metoxy-1,4-benzoquinol methylase
MKPYIGDKTLEIGSGIGNISKIFIQGSKNIDLSDIRDQYVNYLKFEFPNNKVFKINLVNPDFDIAYSKILGSYNLVFALNVIEHIGRLPHFSDDLKI